MGKRIEIIYAEISKKCKHTNCIEFEYYWEIWGGMWHPWFIEINGKSENFTFNDISQNDLDDLVQMGFIELTKVYSKQEMYDEFDRKRYKLKSAANTIDK